MGIQNKFVMRRNSINPYGISKLKAKNSVKQNQDILNTNFKLFNLISHKRFVQILSK